MRIKDSYFPHVHCGSLCNPTVHSLTLSLGPAKSAQLWSDACTGHISVFVKPFNTNLPFHFVKILPTLKVRTLFKVFADGAV